jgi:hypothetical protein
VGSVGKNHAASMRQSARAPINSGCEDDCVKEGGEDECVKEGGEDECVKEEEAEYALEFMLFATR